LLVGKIDLSEEGRKIGNLIEKVKRFCSYVELFFQLFDTGRAGIKALEIQASLPVDVSLQIDKPATVLYQFMEFVFFLAFIEIFAVGQVEPLCDQVAGEEEKATLLEPFNLFIT